MAEPVLTTTALLVGSTKAAVAMVPAIAIMSAAAYGTMSLIVAIDNKLTERSRRKEKEKLTKENKGLSRYQLYILGKETGLSPEEAFDMATKEIAQRSIADMLKANVSIPVPAVTAGV